MADKRLLYFTSRQVIACRWQSGKLEQEASFGKEEDQLAAFSAYVAGAPGSLFFVLADVVEEDFHQETIPYVRGKDRRVLLGRKLAQRYRDLSLALSMSLGYEAGARKEEKILFASFTNTQQFQPWLGVLAAHEARLVGVYSVPLASAALGKRLGLTEKRYLLVSRQTSGMRQTFVDNGQVIFSRLGQIEGDRMEERAVKVATEARRLQQFLVNTRLLGRDAGPLVVVVVYDRAHRAEFEAACFDSPQVRFVLQEAQDAALKAGLKSAPDGMLTEGLFMHTLATSLPPDQFADDSHRRFYHLWRVRAALVSAGLAAFAFCALFSAVRLVDIFNVKQQTAIDEAQTAALGTQYARQQAQFPTLPTTAEGLKALVTNYRLLTGSSASIEPMLFDLSNALASSPRIEIARLEWRIGSPPSAAAGPGANAPAPAPAPAETNSGGAGGREYQILEIAGRVNAAQASDYRNISLLVSQFVEALRARPGVEILSTRLPFDLDAEKSLAGDIGTERAQQVPLFTVIAARKLGS